MSKRNEQDVEWTRYDRDGVAMRRKELSNATDAEQLGCSLYELEPGTRSWPYHYHTANEEAIFVLRGEGTIRLDDGEKSLEVGDYVALPADESGGHQVVNDGDEPLRYLAVSTMAEPDVTVYPEMEKLGVFVGSAPGGRDERSVHGYYPIDGDVGYWEEE